MKTMILLFTMAAVWSLADVPSPGTWGATQNAYIKTSDTQPHQHFGQQVTLDGDTAAFICGGKTYVFVRNGSEWIQQTIIEQYGVLNISGDTLIVGQSFANNDHGSILVYVRSGSSWSLQATLVSPNPGSSDHFGTAVDISSDTIVVGASDEDSSATGVNGNQSDNSADGAGAAYVYVRNDTTWSLQAYLKASNTEAHDNFGSSIAISGNTIVIGARGEDSGSGGVNGNQLDNSAFMAGAAYVFTRSGASWNQQAYLKASNPDEVDWFGGWWSGSDGGVSISGDIIVIGVPHEDSTATGINGDQGNPNGLYWNSGAAYVYARTETSWSQQAYLKGSQSFYEGNFGRSVSASGKRIMVGAPHGGDYSGSAYVYAQDGVSWSQISYLEASNADEIDKFGTFVAISGAIAIAGAPEEDSCATGINGDQADNSCTNAGAAYVFTDFAAADFSATITHCDPGTSDIRLEWIPVAGWHSVVKCSTDLVNMPFTDLSTPLPYPVNSYTDTVSNGKCFYRVDLEP